MSQCLQKLFRNLENIIASQAGPHKWTKKIIIILKNIINTLAESTDLHFRQTWVWILTALTMRLGASLLTLCASMSSLIMQGYEQYLSPRFALRVKWDHAHRVFSRLLDTQKALQEYYCPHMIVMIATIPSHKLPRIRSWWQIPQIDGLIQYSFQPFLRVWTPL